MTMRDCVIFDDLEGVGRDMNFDILELNFTNT